MAAEEWGDIVTETAQSWLREALKNPKTLLDYGKKLWAWFRTDPSGNNRQILIIGPGGVGKSTLGLLLSGQQDLLLARGGAYEESIGVEEYALSADPEIEVVVPPGQEHRRLSTWHEVQRGIADNKFRGIVLVASFGYHSIGDFNYREHRLFEPRDTKAKFLQKYLAERRQQELRILSDLMPHVQMMTERMWLLTVVTKQDLWWSKKDGVQRHYESGAYATKVAELLAGKDPRLFRHETAFCSLLISRFTTGRNDVLQNNVAGFDDPARFASITNLYSKLTALREWETT